MNMNLLVVLSPSSIYHGFSTWKTFWEETFTLVDMEICGCHNVRKHREIKDGEKYIALDIYLNFVSLEKIKTKILFGKIRKGSDYLMGIKTIIRSKKKK